MTKQGVSVVICCYNSANRITETIKYLSRQKFEDEINWEIIVVNNASIDNTVEVAQKAIKQYSNYLPDCKIIDEEKPGLSFARNKGVSEAKYEFIVFCDDDNWLAPNYIDNAYTLILSDNECKIGAWGGKSEAVFEKGIIPPIWFEDYKASYAVGEQSYENGDITKRGYLWGAGLILRKSLYQRVINENIPSLLSDRKGNELTSGGDSEICLRLIIIGYKLYYNENLKFKHYIPSTRLSEEYRDKLHKSFEESYLILRKYFCFIHEIQGSNFSKMKYSIKLVLSKFGLRDLSMYDLEVKKIYNSKILNENKDSYGLMWKLFCCK